MRKPRILVTGAIGKTGNVVVAGLLKAGYPVRPMVHRGFSLTVDRWNSNQRRDSCCPNSAFS
jgi:uncharacterized protein YbjT (DUF2867 family)